MFVRCNPNRKSPKFNPNKSYTLRQAVVEALEDRRLLAAHIVGSNVVYSTIQSAVNAASAGATITVDAGTYDETVTINKSLTLRGAQAGVNARNGRSGSESIVYATKTVFDVTTNDVVIDGFTIEGDDANIGAAWGAGVMMAPSIHGTQVLNNIIQNNVDGIYLSNNSNTDACLIQGNLIQNNFEAGNGWPSPDWNGSCGIYSDGSVSGGLLTNVTINNNTLFNSNFNGGAEFTGMISLVALTANKQFNITVSNNMIGNESKALLAFYVTDLTWIGNTCTGLNDGSSGPVRFEGGANVVNIEYNTIYKNSGPAVAEDNSGVPGDSSGFVVNYNNLYQNDGIGVITADNSYDGPLIAVGDYWGSTNGPSGDGPGTGQAVWGAGTSGHGQTPTGAAGGNVTFSPWATSLINITNIPVPAAPTALAVSSVTSTQINLAWTAPMSTATAQWVQRSTDGVNFTTIATVPPLLNAYSDAAAAAGVNYTYRIIATNSTGNSAAGNVVKASLPSLPAAPQSLTASAGSTTQINLTWSEATPSLTSYTVQRSTDGVSYTTLTSALGGSASGYSDSGLKAGTLYYYRVYAVNSLGTSPASSVASASTLASSVVSTALSSLTWTSATAGWGSPQKNLSVKGNTITLHGVKYSSGIGTHAASTIVYNLAGQYSALTSDVGIDDEEIGVGSGSVDFQVVGDGQILFDSGVLTSSSATVHVAVSVAGVQTLSLIATNGVAGSIDFDHADWAGATLLAPPALPSAPTALTATAVSASQINLAWAAPTGAGASNVMGYIVQRSADGVTFNTIATLGATTTYYDASGLSAGTTYGYRVLATSAAGNSPASATASATTLTTNSIVTNLSTLNWTSATTGWGTVQKNLSVGGNTITLRGATYATGIGTHAASTIIYNLAGRYTNFISDVGVDDEELGKGLGSVDFQVIGDGKVLFDSGVLTIASPIVSLNVNVTGVQTLSLVATNGIAGNIDFDHSDWAGARLLSTPQVPAAPTALSAVTLNATTIKLSWTPPVSTISSYAIDRSTDGTTFTTVATNISAAAVNWTDPAVLSAGTTYYYRIRAINTVGPSANSNVASSVTLAANALAVAVSTLTPVSATAGWGSVQTNQSVAGNPITLRGVTYASGIGTHAASQIVYNLAGNYTSFISDIGVDDEENGKGVGSVDFQVIGDGKVLYDSGVLTNNSPIVSINVNVTGVQQLTLVVNSGVAGSIDYDHADWAGATLISTPAPAVGAAKAAVKKA
jgi:fibronectin type 3 domain-containing protein